MVGRVRTDPEVRFMRFVKERRNGCWEWQSTKMTYGYGTFSYEGKKVSAHRWAYQWFIGEIPRGHDVMHSCDNTSCVNPEHLSTGTRSENMRQCARRGRHVSRKGTPSLTPKEVKEIRKLKGRYEYAEIGEMYGVTAGNIGHIMNRRSWGHV